MNAFMREVASQGEALRDLIQYYRTEGRPAIQAVTGTFRSGRYRRVLFAGMGASYYAPFAVVGYLSGRGIPALALNADEALRYHVDPLADTLPVVISKSGTSKEVVELVARVQGSAPVVGIVNAVGSPLATDSKLKLWMRAGLETQVANRSYLCTLAVLNLLAADLVGEPLEPVLDEHDQLADWISAFLAEAERHTAPLLALASGSLSMDVIGNGPSMSTAYQAALIVREGLRLTTTAVNCADYAHGWYKAIRPGCLGIVLAPEYDEASVEARMVRSITGRGGRVLLVTSSEGPRDEAVAVVRHPAVREWLAPLAQIVPCQTLMGWMMGAGPGA